MVRGCQPMRTALSLAAQLPSPGWLQLLPSPHGASHCVARSTDPDPRTQHPPWIWVHGCWVHGCWQHPWTQIHGPRGMDAVVNRSGPSNLQRKVDRCMMDRRFSVDSYSGALRGPRASLRRLLSPQRNATRPVDLGVLYLLCSQ